MLPSQFIASEEGTETSRRNMLGCVKERRDSQVSFNARSHSRFCLG